MALTILKVENNADEISHIESTDFSSQQKIHIEKILEPGFYIILPRTTGCCCFGSDYTKEKQSNPKIDLFDMEKKTLSPMFMDTLKDTFRKLDIGMNKCLKFKEFQIFWKTIFEQNITEDYFKNNVLLKHSNDTDSLSEKGFISFLKEMLFNKGDVRIRFIIINFLELISYIK